MSLCRPGDEILVSDNVYGPTKEISEDLLKEFKINAIFYDPENFKDLENKVTKKTRIIVVENPGSITFEFQNLSRIINLAKRKNILTFLDNTWGTPLYLKPLKIGFDMSFTSATKYFSGHSDAMGGSLAVNKKVFKKIMFFIFNFPSSRKRRITHSTLKVTYITKTYMHISYIFCFRYI